MDTKGKSAYFAFVSFVFLDRSNIELFTRSSGLPLILISSVDAGEQLRAH
jgi:hypothetical protein